MEYIESRVAHCYNNGQVVNLRARKSLRSDSVSAQVWIAKGRKAAAPSGTGRCELVAGEPARSMYLGDRVKNQDPDAVRR